MANIFGPTARQDLKPRRDPYWSKIKAGCYIGFRKMTADTEGTWFARYFDASEGKQHYRPLGDFAELSPRLRYDAAAEAADEFFKHMGAGGSNQALTIQNVCDRYVAHLRDHKKKPAAAKDAQRRFNAYVTNDPELAKTELQKLTPQMVQKWRRRLGLTPTTAGGNRGELRSDSSLNRDMTCFRSALNLALKNKLCTSDFAWSEALKQIKDADRQRLAYLDVTQRRSLAAKAEPHLAALIRAMSLVPVRPGALAQMKVSDFDRRLHTLRIGRDKTGSRTVALPPTTAKFFAELCGDRVGNLPLLPRDNGSAWSKDAWKKPIRSAVVAAGLEQDVTLYTLRHSVITDLVHDGLDLLTVSQISGTSARMIEKHYGHLTSKQSKAALSRLSL